VAGPSPQDPDWGGSYRPQILIRTVTWADNVGSYFGGRHQQRK